MRARLVNTPLVAALVGLLAGLFGGAIQSVFWTTPTVRAQSSPQKITVRELNLVDAAGMTRAKIATGEDGGVRLSLNNTLGLPVIALAVTDEGAAVIAVLDDNRETRFSVLVSGDTTELTISDKDGRTRVTLGVSKDDEAFVRVADKASKGGVLMVSKTGGESVVSVWDLEGIQRVGLGTSADLAAVVSVEDSGGRTRVLLGTTQKGEPMIEVLNEKGESVWNYSY